MLKQRNNGSRIWCSIWIERMRKMRGDSWNGMPRRMGLRLRMGMRRGRDVIRRVVGITRIGRFVDWVCWFAGLLCDCIRYVVVDLFEIGRARLCEVGLVGPFFEGRGWRVTDVTHYLLVFRSSILYTYTTLALHGEDVIDYSYIYDLESFPVLSSRFSTDSSPCS